MLFMKSWRGLAAQQVPLEHTASVGVGVPWLTAR